MLAVALWLGAPVMLRRLGSGGELLSSPSTLGGFPMYGGRAPAVSEREGRGHVERLAPGRRDLQVDGAAGAVRWGDAVLGRGRPYFGPLGIDPVLLDDPTTVIQSNRILHLVYPVRR